VLSGGGRPQDAPDFAKGCDVQQQMGYSGDPARGLAYGLLFTSLVVAGGALGVWADARGGTPSIPLGGGAGGEFLALVALTVVAFAVLALARDVVVPHVATVTLSVLALVVAIVVTLVRLHDATVLARAANGTSGYAGLGLGAKLALVGCVALVAVAVAGPITAQMRATDELEQDARRRAAVTERARRDATPPDATPRDAHDRDNSSADT
jgi:hypothetical protein